MKSDQELKEIAEKCLIDIVLYCYHYEQDEALKKYGINQIYSIVKIEAKEYIIKALKEVNDSVKKKNLMVNKLNEHN